MQLKLDIALLKVRNAPKLPMFYGLDECNTNSLVLSYICENVKEVDLSPSEKNMKTQNCVEFFF